MSEFRYPLPNGDEFRLNIDHAHWTDPEILKLLERIKHADLLYESLKKLVVEMAPMNLIAQSQDYRDAEVLLALLE